ncbi:hypothetical protein NDU88_006900 [Pleurodeles waltl]|uniref:Uncharacterized protein n=1 Tax=Pleurodeles waltl TaxID=8319 RepID=A0AAV7PMQ7_PLEWA|nr:hypothetical protein NDU88_006900 [Pleurodeles waltl]
MVGGGGRIGGNVVPRPPCGPWLPAAGCSWGWDGLAAALGAGAFPGAGLVCPAGYGGQWWRWPIGPRLRAGRRCFWSGCWVPLYFVELWTLVAAGWLPASLALR